MLDHLGIKVSDYERSRILRAALAPLGIALLMEPVAAASAASARDGNAVLLVTDRAAGARRRPRRVRRPIARRSTPSTPPRSRPAGPTTARPACGVYHPRYYGAFVLDPDGNNVEAVCHKPE